MAAVVLPALGGCAPAQRDSADSAVRAGTTFTWAVLGDVPEGVGQLRQLPDVIDRLSAAPGVRMAFHLGGIKGLRPCSDGYYRQIREAFDRSRVPLAYTFGGEEWLDCGRSENGGFDPQERLAALRHTFVPRPGYTLGRPVPVDSQAGTGFPENLVLVRPPVTFAAFHTVEAALDPVPGHSPRSLPFLVAEEARRSDAAVRLIREGFRSAASMQSAAVVLLTHADLFPPGAPDPATVRAYRPVVRAIAAGTRGFRGEVYLFTADRRSHVTDAPLARGSRWPDAYDVAPLDTLTRVTVDGGAGATSYLSVTARRHARPVVSWTRVRVPGQAPAAGP